MESIEWIQLYKLITTSFKVSLSIGKLFQTQLTIKIDHTKIVADFLFRSSI